MSKALKVHQSVGAYIDAEIGSLEDLLDISGHKDAIDAIGALSELHLAADASRDDIERLLERAVAPLERLLAHMRTIPLDGPLAGPAPRISTPG